MKIHKSINAGDVHLDLAATKLEEALGVVGDLVSRDMSIPSESVVSALLERERLGSTSVGDGFAIPHCKLHGLRQIRVALTRFVDGIDFESGNGDLVRFFFVVLSPPDQPAAHLQVLSQIARILKRSDLRSELLAAIDADAVISAIRTVAEAEGL